MSKGLVVLVGAAVVGICHADVITLGAVATGYYYTGSFTPVSYLTGVSLPWADDTRGMMAFDLSQIPAGAVVTSATFKLDNPSSVNEFGPGDPLGLDILRTVAIDGLNYTNGNNYGFIQTLFSPVQATKFVLPSDSGTVLSINLGSSGVSGLNSDLSNTFYSFGMKIRKADVDAPKPIQIVFGDTFTGATARMEVTYTPAPVPEPVTLVGLVGGLGMLVQRRRYLRIRG